MDKDTVVALSVATTALCCSFIFWLGERRAESVSEANARAYRQLHLVKQMT